METWGYPICTARDAAAHARRGAVHSRVVLCVKCGNICITQHTHTQTQNTHTHKHTEVTCDQSFQDRVNKGGFKDRNLRKIIRTNQYFFQKSVQTISIEKTYLNRQYQVGVKYTFTLTNFFFWKQEYKNGYTNTDK